MRKTACLWVLLAVIGHTAPDHAEQDKALAAIRAYALNYTNQLPDFTCTQVTQRTIFPVMAFRGHPLHDSYEEQIIFVEHKETYKVTKINGNAVANVRHDELGGIHSSGEFGTLLSDIFTPDTGTEFRWQKSSSSKRQRLSVFAFRVPAAKGYGLVGSRGTILVAYKGLLYADAQTGAVLRIEMECEIPHDSEYQRLELTLDYKPIEVAGHAFNLPSHFHLHSIKEAPPIAGPSAMPTKSPGVLSETTNEADYKSYRRFDAESEITFGDDVRPNH